MLAALVAGCHPYVSAGVDSSWRVHGPLAAVINQTVATRQTSGAGESPPPTGNSYAAEIGGKVRDFSVGVGLQAHDASSASFSLPSFNSGQQAPDSPHFLAATGSIDVRWNWLKLRYFNANIHAGPARTMLFDRMTADVSWGNGYRYGAGFGVALGAFGVFLDAYHTGVVFGDGPANGYSELTGVTIGASLNR